MKAYHSNTPTRPTRSTRAVIRCRPEHKKAIEQAAKLERARLELEEMKRKQGKKVRYAPRN